MKRFNNQVDFSLVSIYFQPKTEKVKLGPIGFVFVNLFEGVK